MIVRKMMRTSLSQSKSINHRVSPKEATSVASLKGTVTLELKKKTLHQVYNQVMMCENLGFPNFSKGEPINNLMREIKSQVRKQTRLTKKENYIIIKELLEFWPLSIVIPSMLILILMANILQW